MDKYAFPEPNTGCWLWSGTFVEGHPKINTENRTRNAVRAIYEYTNQITLVPKRQVLHNKCGQKACVNPDHYELCTVTCPPEKQTKILTSEQVIEIKKLLTSGLSQSKISATIGTVSRSAIQAIANGKAWKSVQI